MDTMLIIGGVILFVIILAIIAFMMMGKKTDEKKEEKKEVINCILSDWGVCDKLCGGGKKTRTIITQPANGGTVCGTVEEACNTQQCIVSLSKSDQKYKNIFDSDKSTFYEQTGNKNIELVLPKPMRIEKIKMLLLIRPEYKDGGKSSAGLEQYPLGINISLNRNNIPTGGFLANFKIISNSSKDEIKEFTFEAPTHSSYETDKIFIEVQDFPHPTKIYEIEVIEKTN